MLIELTPRQLAITHMLKYLSERADDLKPSHLDWAIIYEDYYKKHGDLTNRQLEVLMDIYSKY